mmetsp:Transcript_9152/g.30131  ORF Transcript_9152/g.30131 Transcript_9152/m.30131 type:complete len:168 (+) Transcript_9152:23-526(+)
MTLVRGHLALGGHQGALVGRCKQHKRHISSRASGAGGGSVQLQGVDPERRAARASVNLMTMVAVQLILTQEASYDNEGGSALGGTYRLLTDFLDQYPLTNSTEWLEKMMKHPNPDLGFLALRVMEVREAYADEGFDYEKMRSEVKSEMESDQKELTRIWISARMGTP